MFPVSLPFMDSEIVPLGARQQSQLEDSINNGYARGAAQAVPDPSQRFRGFLPVVVDVETGGFDSHKVQLRSLRSLRFYWRWTALGSYKSKTVIPRI